MKKTNLAIKYIRTSDRKPIGVVVGTDKGIGWSVCCRKDQFSKKLALKIARSRAANNNGGHIPNRPMSWFRPETKETVDGDLAQQLVEILNEVSGRLENPPHIFYQVGYVCVDCGYVETHKFRLGAHPDISFECPQCEGTCVRKNALNKYSD